MGNARFPKETRSDEYVVESKCADAADESKDLAILQRRFAVEDDWNSTDNETPIAPSFSRTFLTGVSKESIRSGGDSKCAAERSGGSATTYEGESGARTGEHIYAIMKHMGPARDAAPTSGTKSQKSSLFHFSAMYCADYSI